MPQVCPRAPLAGLLLTPIRMLTSSFNGASGISVGDSV